MNSGNIEIGIDLGTTNSEVAVRLKNGEVQIVKNIYHDEYTPSVFGIDKALNKVIGKKSYESLYKNASIDDFDNTKAEVKRLMGTSDKVNFPRISKELSPEEISSEILKTLKEDVLRKYPNTPTNGVVITIPAYFSTLQAEATKRAGNLVGFKHVVLIQEPIAAAISYGFMNSQNENWLVFDLGGGTFDVALISSKDGALTVLGHNGDNFLGGKDFDWAIVDKVIVPKLLEQYSLNDFSRGNKKYRSVFSRLKYFAESCKMVLSQVDEHNLTIEGIGNDDTGKEIYLNIKLLRSEFESIIKQFIDKAIDLSRETISESGVKQSSVSKIVLVGGPTMIPYIRNRLSEDLQLEVDTSSDPLTAVAKGACIFGASQTIPMEFIEPIDSTKDESINIKLNYEAMTADDEETITGIIDIDPEQASNYSIQIQSEGGFFSGKKLILKNSKFLETLSLEKNKSNLFWVYLYDDSGNPIKTNPEHFTITHGMSISGAPIPHSIGVGVAKKDFTKSSVVLTEEFEKIFEKNSILPLKTTKTYKTARKLTKGDNNNALPIKVREGESMVPDQNNFICDLKLTGEKLPYDLPEGSDVDITISVSESRVVTVDAYIPLMDLIFSARATVHAENLSIDEIESQLNEQKDRLSLIDTQADKNQMSRVENLVESISNSLTTAKVDEDEKRKADSQLRELKIKLDSLHSENKFPQLQKEFYEIIENIDKVSSKDETEENTRFKEQFDSIKSEGEAAIKNNDHVLLSKVIEQLSSLENNIVFSDPSSWVYFFGSLVNIERDWTSKSEAEYFTNKGRQSIENNDTEELKRSVRGLMALLPTNDREMLDSNMSGIMK
jgi:molecular chaperone DnaK